MRDDGNLIFKILVARSCTTSFLQRHFGKAHAAFSKLPGLVLLSLNKNVENYSQKTFCADVEAEGSKKFSKDKFWSPGSLNV